VDDIVTVLEACHKLDYLKVIKLKEALGHKEYLALYTHRNKIVEVLQRNVSLQYIELTEEHSEKDFTEVQNEFETNEFNEPYKAQLRNSAMSVSVPLSISNIKL